MGFNPGMIKTAIVQARTIVRPFGEGGERYRTVDRALVYAEEMIDMIKDDTGRPIDKHILRAGMRLLSALDNANIEGDIEHVVATAVPGQAQRYRLLIRTFYSERDDAAPPAIVGTEDQLLAMLRHMNVPKGWTPGSPGEEVGEGL